MTALGILWYFLVFLLIAGYFVLDGFDLGAGTLYPFIAKDEDDQKTIRLAIGPVWDGNEVWLLTAGGALFAAFPDAYATTFSGFYLAIMLVLFSLIVRAVSLEFWGVDSKWRGIWDVCFFLGSALPALLFGVAIGNVLQGIPMDAAGNYIGIPLLGLITPFTLMTGLLGLSMFLAAGACWIALKAPVESGLRMRAASLRMPLQVVSIVLFVICTGWMFGVMGGTAEMDPALEAARWLFVALYAICMVAAIVLGRSTGSSAGGGDAASGNGDLMVFLMQSIAAVALVFLLACSMFPVLVMASPESIGGPVTIATAGASELSLTCMTIILCIGLPFVLVYHFLVYRTFRGRVNLSAQVDSE